MSRVIHIREYAAKDHVACQEEASFWRKDGYRTQIIYREEIWLLIVMEDATE